MASYQHLEVEQRGAVRWLWLNRPEFRNAFNDGLVADISAAFAEIEASPVTRVVVVAARGPAFCAGADLNWMRSMANFSHADNHADALRVARMFQAVHACSKPVIGRVQGDAFGGRGGQHGPSPAHAGARDRRDHRIRGPACATQTGEDRLRSAAA